MERVDDVNQFHSIDSTNKISYKYILLFLLWVLTGGSVFAVMYRNGLLAAFILFLGSLFLIEKVRIYEKNRKAFISTFVTIIFCITVNYIFSVKPQEFSKYAYLSLVFFTQGLFCVFLFSNFTYDRFLIHFYKILSLIRTHAILNAVVITLFPFLLSHHVLNEFSGYEGDTFMFVFNKRADQYSFSILGFALTRNQGLFWEPGVLQFYLNFLLFLQLYVMKKINKRDVFFTIIAIVSTYSTTAYLIMIIIATVFVFRILKKYPLSLIPLLLVGVMFLFPLLSANLENKLLGENQTSSAVRFYDFLQQLIVVRDNPIVGVGLDDQRYADIRGLYRLPQEILDYMGISPENRGSSNSILFLLGTLGIPMAFIWIFGYINQPFIKKNKLTLRIFLILSVMVEPLLLKPFFMTFIFGGLMFFFYNKSKKKKSGTLWKTELIHSNGIRHEHKKM